MALVLVMGLYGCGGDSSKETANPYKGYYAGVYSNSSVSGAWSFTVNSGGNITGIAEDNVYSYALTGSAEPDGKVSVTGAAGEAANAAVRRSFVSDLGDVVISFDFEIDSGSITGVWERSDNQSGSSNGLKIGGEGTAPANSAPQISGTPMTGITTGGSYFFVPNKFDADNDTLIFNILNKPDWAEFDDSTGALSGTPESAGISSGITITVSDGNGGFDSLPPFSITVEAANTPPVIFGTPQTSITAGSAYSFTPAASDADMDSLVFDIAGKPSWLDFSTATGNLSGTPTNADTGTTGSIVISVTDGRSDPVSLAPFTVTVNFLNSPPSISGTPSASVSAVEAVYSFLPAASDPDAHNLTFSIQNMPDWASFSTTTGALTGSPKKNDAGVYEGVVISVSDGHGGTDSLDGFSITVTAKVIKTGQTADYVDYDDSYYSKGLEMGYSRTGNIVTDNITGLMWQDDAEAVSITEDWFTAPAYCEALELDNHTDWRLPNILELESLVDFGRYSLALNPVFQNAASEPYWTTGDNAVENSFGWSVRFQDGGSNYSVNASDKSALKNIRCVRGKEMGKGVFTRDADNETVTDSVTLLMWQDDAEAGSLTYGWSAALIYCEALELGGYADWRMPNIKELKSIVDYERGDQSIDPAFEHTANTYYWSSTTFALDSQGAWFINFYDGNDRNYVKTHIYNIRCVRDAD
ncbi:DUF1566 domain-containing protein [Geovibrio thiophilus]|uniref:DUF1566 domain-containing protein n=1 Tax=Geovibrio thiophilus TaxID=139438 RepID=A0A410JVB7_9BACT|nr:DUF1566 domain-containing protein [Geovibrio thiophilus]QAR32124.1 DUF1566 domain-containing protein [Geovibrio thiophilus]